MNSKGFPVVVVVSFLVLVSPSVAKLTQLPDNVDAVTGDSVRLKCFTERKDYPPSWSHIRVGSTQPNDVYLTVRMPGQEAIAGRMTQEYHGRFSVLEDRTTGEYSLQVTNIQAGDAGRYTCTARGGLGQQASAELGVIEPHSSCASNTTEAIGENICNHEPDSIELSCSFRYKGNVLPKVNWVKTDRPDQVVIITEARFTDVSGEAVSKFIVKADTAELHGSSFMCIVSSSNDPEESRLSCTTPVINVLKISNLTVSRTVDKPEEVECNPPPHLTQTGCKWVKRKLEGDMTETVVTNGRLLNLYRPEFESGGIYVCIVECSIRGQPCPVEALTITYEPADPSRGRSSVPHSTSTSIIIIAVVLSVVFTLAITVLGVMLYRKFTPRPSQHSAEELSTPINSSNQSSISSHEVRLTSGPEDIPLTVTGRDGVAVYDMPDSIRLPAQPGDRERRNREAEERALVRMRKNAALRQLSDDAVDGGDVAEGIRGESPEKSKDE